MRRSLAVAIVVALGLVAAAPAGAAGPTLRSLQAQITTLKKQVKTLKKQVKAEQNFALGSLVYNGCAWAATADALQNTWTTVDQRVPAPPAFGAQTAVNDYGACQSFRIVRARTQVPPNTAVFQALLDIFKQSSSAVSELGVNFPSQGGYLFGQLFVLPR